MKNEISVFILLFIFLSNTPCYSQTGWYLVNPLPQTNHLSDIQFIDNSTAYIVGHNGVFIKTTDKGLNWSVNYIDSAGGIERLSFVNSETGYILVSDKLKKTTNAGLNWITIYDTNYTGGITAIKFLNDNTGVIAGVSGRVRFTTNGGTSWLYRSINTGSPPLIDIWNADYRNIDTCSLVGRGGFPYQNQHGIIFKTTNQGINWITQFYDINSTSQFFYDIYYLNQNEGIAVGEYGRYTKTTNGGLDWIAYNAPGSVHMYKLKFINEFIGYAGGLWGVLVTTNGGNNWQLQTGSQYPLRSLDFADSMVGLAVGDQGTIIRTTTGGFTGFGSLSSNIPVEYCLNQNYPNPFNPKTKINYDIPKNSFVKLIIYDILGREVIRLVNNEFKQPGRYVVEFNGTNLASGVYFYRIEAGDYVNSKKMVLVK